MGRSQLMMGDFFNSNFLTKLGEYLSLFSFTAVTPNAIQG